MVADELELVRVGIAAAIAPLGIGVVAECRSGREAHEEAAFALADVVIIGAVSDGSTLDALRLLGRLEPRPIRVGLFARAGDPEAGEAAVIGVEGLALRSSSVVTLADVVERSVKGELAVIAELEAGFVGTEIDAAGTDDGVGLLSPREREMLRFLADGRTNREIAATLSISVATVKTHLVRLYGKLEAKNRNEALSRAVAARLLR